MLAVALVDLAVDFAFLREDEPAGVAERAAVEFRGQEIGQEIDSLAGLQADWELGEMPRLGAGFATFWRGERAA